jgi:hypothetical protein
VRLAVSPKQDKGFSQFAIGYLVAQLSLLEVKTVDAKGGGRHKVVASTEDHQKIEKQWRRVMNWMASSGLCPTT